METPFAVKLEAIFKRHYKEWCLIAFSYVGDAYEAEDVVQDVFVKLLLKDEPNALLNLKSYIHVAVCNTAIKQVGKRKKRVNMDWLSSSTPSYETEVIKSETALDVFQKIEALPEQCRKVFKLCIMDGQKYEMAAEVCGISVNTVKYHIKKSFKILRFTLKNAYLLAAYIMYLA